MKTNQSEHELNNNDYKSSQLKEYILASHATPDIINNFSVSKMMKSLLMDATHSAVGGGTHIRFEVREKRLIRCHVYALLLCSL